MTAEQKVALEHGDAMAESLRDRGLWTFVDWSSYRALSPERRSKFWAGLSPAPLTDPLAGLVTVFSFLGGAWLLVQLVTAWRRSR